MQPQGGAERQWDVTEQMAVMQGQGGRLSPAASAQAQAIGKAALGTSVLTRWHNTLLLQPAKP